MPAARPSYANVMSTVAVVLALTTGTAYAAGLGRNSVKSRHIASNAVVERHISSNAVRERQLAADAVTARQLADGSVQGPDLANDSVSSRAVADGSLSADDLGANSVGKSELKADTVDSSRIQNGQVRPDDIADGAINNTKLSSGVRRLMYDAGALAVNQTYADVTVSNSAWPGGAPSSGAQLSGTWTQPINSLDIVSMTARVEYPSGCSATAGTPRGFDVKITDGSDRVISASSPERTGSVNYNGNGFWNQQVDLPGVSFRAPSGSDLADSPAAFIDYIHLPFEMAEQVTGSSAATRTVRVFLKRNSSSCSPVITDARLLVYRFANG